jgi:iron complex outermembrane receptor protein
MRTSPPARPTPGTSLCAQPPAIATALSAALLAGAAFAQSPNSQAPAPGLAPVTVSATGLDTPAGETATPVTVLGADELVQRRAATLGETLDGQPGIRASQFGAGSSRPIIRGMDGARVRVLSDGAEVMDASTVSPDHAVTIEPLLSRRIEVLRGPSALAYGAGAIGGVVNVLDDRVPTRMPRGGLEGSVELRGESAAREGVGAFGVTAGSGSFAMRAEGLTRRAGDYAVGGGWSEGARVANSWNHTETGSLGLAWVGARGYLGLAYQRQQSRYGLPGHGHSEGECHLDGDHLHCGSHEGESDAADAHKDARPWVDLISNRWDLRGEYREPFAGFAKLRVRSALTRYAHDEIEGDAVGTRFRNKGREGRLELEHHPIAGWRGVAGIQLAQRDFSATGEEAYLQPTSTRRQGLYLIEERRSGPWRFEFGLRHEWQQVDVQSMQPDARHRGTSASVGAHWRFDPSWSLGLALSRAQRLPTAEELYADGRHLATQTFERGNPNLRPETSQNLDLTLRRVVGDTRVSLSAFHNRVNDYIYARTLDTLDDLRLVEYTQRDATFQGLEAQVRQKLAPALHVTVFGDLVRAQLAAGDGNRNLPRIPAGRLGVRLDTFFQGWDAMLEWYRVMRQNRVEDLETPTAGYSMINAGISRNARIGGLDTQIYLSASNLADVLAFNHASYLKNAAPLMGRRIMAGVRANF